jgi:tetratricopeptide (TPR) repeat protein
VREGAREFPEKGEAPDVAAPDHVPRRDDVKVAASPVRCPFCHADVAPAADDWVACRGCLARHHAGCWEEAKRCSACGHDVALPSNVKARPKAERRHTLAAAVILVLVLLAVTLVQRARIATETELREASNAPFRANAVEDANRNIRETRAILADKLLEQALHQDEDGAIATLSRAIELRPDFSVLWNNRGVLRDGKGDHDGAIADYTRAIELGPTVEGTHRNRGRAYLSQGKLDAAILDFTREIELGPKLASSAHLERGRAYEKKGDMAAARQDYGLALDRALTDAEREQARAKLAALDRR